MKLATLPQPAQHQSVRGGADSDRRQFSGSDWALFATVGLIWGSSYLLIKVALDGFHPGLITWGRVALAAVVLLAFRRKWPRIDRADWWRIVVLSVVWVGVPFTLFPLAEQHISSAATGLLTGATPLFTGLVGALWFARPSRGPQRAGIAIGFAGVALIAVSSGAGGDTAPLGVAMVLAATVCYGVATNIAGPLLHRYGSVPVMTLMLGLAAVWTAPFGVVGLAASEFSATPAIATATLGVVGTGAAFVLMATLIGRVGGPRASFITYLIPLVALVLGAVLLAESVTTFALVGAALVLTASVLASRPER